MGRRVMKWMKKKGQRKGERVNFEVSDKKKVSFTLFAVVGTEDGGVGGGGKGGIAA